MIFDRIERWESYAGLHPGLARGLRALADGGLASLAPGRHELDGERLYISVQEYAPKPPDQGRWEIHRRYLDIQVVTSGRERIAFGPRGPLAAEGEFDAARDIGFYAGGPEAGSTLALEPGSFAVFFPGEEHMPSLAADAARGTVRKLVVKVAWD